MNFFLYLRLGCFPFTSDRLRPEYFEFFSGGSIDNIYIALFLKILGCIFSSDILLNVYTRFTSFISLPVCVCLCRGEGVPPTSIGRHPETSVSFLDSYEALMDSSLTSNRIILSHFPHSESFLLFLR